MSSQHYLAQTEEPFDQTCVMWTGAMSVLRRYNVASDVCCSWTKLIFSEVHRKVVQPKSYQQRMDSSAAVLPGTGEICSATAFKFCNANLKPPLTYSGTIILANQHNLFIATKSWRKLTCTSSWGSMGKEAKYHSLASLESGYGAISSLC